MIVKTLIKFAAQTSNFLIANIKPVGNTERVF